MPILLGLSFVTIAKWNLSCLGGSTDDSFLRCRWIRIPSPPGLVAYFQGFCCLADMTFVGHISVEN